MEVVSLKRADWGRVKLHDRLIYADLYDGVYAAKVIQVDIQIPGELGQYPYGKAVDTGAIKVEIVKEGVKVQLIENLSNLVRWDAERFRELKDLWSTLKDQKDLVTSLEADFNTELAEAREV